jgi:DNA-binding winged helix-turn-helix (wHTH) protein
VKFSARGFQRSCICLSDTIGAKGLVRIRFNDLVLDTGRRELLRGSEPVRLAPKAFQLLEILVVQRPNAVSQEELYDRLWPDTFVEKSNVHNLIYQIREALDDRDQTIVRTVYGFGFSFGAAAVDDEAAATRWQIVIGDREFDLCEGENLVGRERDVAIRIDAPSISRYHARIVVTSDVVSIEDLGSKNGTSLQGRRLREVNRLANGDKILFGTVAATLRSLRAPKSTETAR